MRSIRKKIKDMYVKFEKERPDLVDRIIGLVIVVILLFGINMLIELVKAIAA